MYKKINYENKSKLDFKKKSIVELNDNQLKDVNGSFTTLTPVTLSIASLVAVTVHITKTLVCRILFTRLISTPFKLLNI